ncbi:hypothetical protein [Nocardia bovistercoris]|uniref:Low molecular weight antigen MTB12-like C-terminal domain-containing protein n=1 Tax=Nocardia bovistercoris TaxID=2785916 RepID=A0A931N784_9NOCA|nr:hypothetical protein [Nocardia bovistercoris]MBH0780488.1 hypothetical protein [Nocardia bovistercoris]
MVRASKFVLACVAVALFGMGAVAPASADVSLRDAKVGDLYVSAAEPSLDQLERQFAAFWNPNIGIGPKVEVSYNGPSARAELEKVMQFSKTMDFFSLQGRAVGPVRISGDSLSVTVHGVMAGIPAQTTNYHFLRDAGLWKFDWKRICQELQCSGNPDFGY